jgi:hypothetical protein
MPMTAVNLQQASNIGILINCFDRCQFICGKILISCIDDIYFTKMIVIIMLSHVWPALL